jgi:hypothetical protein
MADTYIWLAGFKSHFNASQPVLLASFQSCRAAADYFAERRMTVFAAKGWNLSACRIGRFQPHIKVAEKSGLYFGKILFCEQRFFHFINFIGDCRFHLLTTGY